jgi:hypothetical protein
MTQNSSNTLEVELRTTPSGWSELWRKEDWWAVWLGLAITLVAYGLFVSGSSINFLAVAPAKWSSFPQLVQHFEANLVRYVAQFAVFLGVFTIAASAIGYPVRRFAPGFAVVYVLSLIVFSAGAWD